jgi:bifunctional non-homologous end joining protein LigD
MQRYPDGIMQEGFYQKEIGDYFPAWIERKTITHKAGHQTTYVLCNNSATLVYLANQATITVHHWLSTSTKLRSPDRMIFDLDPSNTPWPQLIETAQQLKKILKSYKLSPFVMTTGSRGLHVTVPLKQIYTFKQVRTFAQQIAQKLIEKHPALATLEIRKEKRKNKIFIDTLRNQWAQHAVAPYTIRAIEQAPIAMPLSWKELENPKLTAQTYTLEDVLRHPLSLKHPWGDFSSSGQLFHV